MVLKRGKSSHTIAEEYKGRHVKIANRSERLHFGDRNFADLDSRVLRENPSLFFSGDGGLKYEYANVPVVAFLGDKRR